VAAATVASSGGGNLNFKLKLSEPLKMQFPFQPDSMWSIPEISCPATFSFKGGSFDTSLSLRPGITLDDLNSKLKLSEPVKMDVSNMPDAVWYKAKPNHEVACPIHSKDGLFDPSLALLPGVSLRECKPVKMASETYYAMSPLYHEGKLVGEVPLTATTTDGIPIPKVPDGLVWSLTKPPDMVRAETPMRRLTGDDVFRRNTSKKSYKARAHGFTRRA